MKTLHPSVIYLSFDGLLQPLGYSQIARVLMRLSGEKLRYHVISLERASDLAHTNRVKEVRATLDGSGVVWTHAPYDERGGLKAARRNYSRLLLLSSLALRDGSCSLVHARGYQSAMIARVLQLRFGVRYLFDARGAWVDERMNEGNWVARPGIYHVSRSIERRLYADAIAMVTLTELHAEGIRSGRFGRYSGAPVVTIPTCADYDEFTPRQREARSGAGGPIIAIIGSMNASYRTERMLYLASRVLHHHPGAQLLILSRQKEEFNKAREQAGIPAERCTIRSVHHSEMATELQDIDWGLQLLTDGPAKLGSVPTKMAEFFAAGVRVAHYGCNAEVGEWVSKSGTGLVLDDLSDQTLDSAAKEMGTGLSPEEAQAGRERTASHFSLESGVDRYVHLLSSLELE